MGQFTGKKNLTKVFFNVLTFNSAAVLLSGIFLKIGAVAIDICGFLMA